ncbi:META domain-containing protein [Streptomyces sp. NPDC093225]|uniref:META domain-containing protein n=1 Tax=Streptomyces sp. NPDC093225 TaxID=3366034 RepID=UPI0038309F72
MRTHHVILATAAAAATLLLSGCGTATSTTESDAKGKTVVDTAARPKSAPLAGTRWNVTGLLAGKAAASLPAGSGGKAYLVIGQDGTAHGNTGCNDFHTTAKTTGSTVQFGPIAATGASCTGPYADLDAAVTAVLSGPVTYGVQAGTLTLTGAEGKGLRATAE